MTQNENLNLSNKLHVVRMVESGITLQATTNKFVINLSIVSKILQARDQLETVRKTTSRRKKLALLDKLRAIHLTEVYKNDKTNTAGICDISRQPARNIWNNRNILLDNENNSSFLEGKLPIECNVSCH